MEVCGESASTCRDSAFWVSRSFVFLAWLPAPEILNIGNLEVCSQVRRKLRWLVFQNTPKMAVPLGSPNPLTCDLTVLKHINYTQKTSGRDCEGEVCRILKTRWAKITNVNGHLYGLGYKSGMCPEDGCVFLLPPEGCNPSSSAMSQDWKSKVCCPGTKRSQRVTVPHCTSNMPSTCPHVVLRKHPNSPHHEGRRIPFIIFFFFK